MILSYCNLAPLKTTRNKKHKESIQSIFDSKKLWRKIYWDKKSISFPNGNSLPRQKKNFVLFLTMVCLREAYISKKHPGYLLEFTPQLYLRKPLFESTKKSVPRKKKTHKRRPFSFEKVRFVVFFQAPRSVRWEWYSNLQEFQERDCHPHHFHLAPSQPETFLAPNAPEICSGAEKMPREKERRAMENSKQLEDVSPIENGDCQLSC